MIEEVEIAEMALFFCPARHVTGHHIGVAQRGVRALIYSYSAGTTAGEVYFAGSRGR